jgi:hypothetical protein
MLVTLEYVPLRGIQVYHYLDERDPTAWSIGDLRCDSICRVVMLMFILKLVLVHLHNFGDQCWVCQHTFGWLVYIYVH